MTKTLELKAMIKSFRVVDLNVLLLFAGKSRRGKKKELQLRALKLLDSKSPPLISKIKKIYESVPKYITPDQIKRVSAEKSPVSGSKGTAETGDGESLENSNDIAIVDESFLESNASTPNLSEQSSTTLNCAIRSRSNSLGLPVHPDVRFKNLPFYKVINELLRPSSLVPEKVNLHQRNTFTFYITPQQAAAIYNSRVTRPGLLDEYRVLVLLRFCLLETTSVQNDAFPSCLVLRVNSKYCYLQGNPVKKKKNEFDEEPAPPVDITPLIKLAPSHPNKIEVQWFTKFGDPFVVAVYLVQKESSETLLNSLKVNGVRSADYTRGMIKDKLNEEADSEIVTTSLRVSLVCPLGKIRLKTPCRATTCPHLQCFDASTYLQMNEKKPTWLCPVCDKSAEYDKLFIDGYFLEILSSDKLSPAINDIQLQSNGLWKPNITELTDRSDVKLETEDVDVVLDDDDIDDDKVPQLERSASQVVSNDSLLIDCEKRKADEIDLTRSDSDDEPLLYSKRRKKSKHKRNRKARLSSSSSSSRSSPSTVNLVTDSSESLSPIIPTPVSPL